MGRRFGSELGWSILNAVADGVEIFEQATRRPTALLRYGLSDLKILDAERERRCVQNALLRLKRQKMIREIRRDRRRAYCLTRLGQIRLVARTTEIPLRLQGGRQTVVSFDIPERFKEARAVFRHFLRRKGFRQLHRSVWISDLDWMEEILNALKTRDLIKWVYVFRAEGIPGLDVVPVSV